ncbi:FAD-dependent oxidoreductase [Mycolicibacterium peregrinum]|uniref:FAD-dependent oxidoreductase n=1 Tax=Mycolicibacterium peregrinum TaxID=43304 RepID=UPI0006D777DA|nr:FAD-dependent oxidoreductase [Mycolicibacterium peregrinum]MCV7200512.1 FAD-dependent oxidoreductase [Mycolicibacterium peregrinum]ORW55977.1 ferredoxin [Mycolicibacterium peregrinum]
MAYVITQNCCKDASCVPVCPVDCIRPAEGGLDSASAEMLYIDPESCIDCGACFEECPVGAIHYEEDLPGELQRFKDLNAAYFERHPLEPVTVPAAPSRAQVEAGSLRVAIVGSGPAACYAAAELIDVDGVEINLFERLPTPFGLIRAGVAPDHQNTKSVVDIFERAFTNPRFASHFNVEVGRTVNHDELLAHHHAVIYAVGAATSRRLGIDGEDLTGHHAAAEFVGWYNGHPDHAAHRFDLSGERAVIVGNGNVALDVARVLLMDRDALAATDIAQHTLDALADSAIREVVILARRGIEHAAFSAGEFQALGHLDGVDVIVDPADLPDDDEHDDVETSFKLAIAREYAQRTSTPGNRRVVFRFGVAPAAIVGAERAEGLEIGSDRRGTEVIETSLILRSIGYRGLPVAGLPYDEDSGTVPSDLGRVVPGTYVTGWIKRGPRGVIGTNRLCAEQTVTQLWVDFDAGLLTRDVEDRESLDALLAARGAEPLGWSGWRAIDVAERDRGVQAARPRVKFVSVEAMLSAGLRG